MLKKSTKNILIFSGVLDVILVIVLGVMIFHVDETNLVSLKTVSDIKTEIKREEMYFSQRKDAEDSQINISKVAGFIVKADSVVDFMKDLDNLTLNNGLKSEVKAVSVEALPGNFSNVELLNIKISVTGEWRNVEYFLKLLENYPLKIDIKNVSLSKFSDYIVRGKKVPQWLGDFEFTVLKSKE